MRVICLYVYYLVDNIFIYCIEEVEIYDVFS